MLSTAQIGIGIGIGMGMGIGMEEYGGIVRRSCGDVESVLKTALRSICSVLRGRCLVKGDMLVPEEGQ
jgi:hypothetical protein